MWLSSQTIAILHFIALILSSDVINQLITNHESVKIG